MTTGGDAREMTRCCLCAEPVEGDLDAVEVGGGLVHEECLVEHDDGEEGRVERGKPDEGMKPPSLDWATLVEWESQLVAIREHRQTHPTASEAARARWEGEQKRLHGCDYIDVNGERVCAVHGSAPMKKEARGDTQQRTQGRMKKEERR